MGESNLAEQLARWESLLCAMCGGHLGACDPSGVQAGPREAKEVAEALCGMEQEKLAGRGASSNRPKMMGWEWCQRSHRFWACLP
jgi:hypothetical protein